MKKLFTLVTALLAMCNVTKVQAFSTTDLPTGYYKIKSCATGSEYSHLYLFNDAFGTNVNVSLLSQTTAETNNYVWKITNSGSTTIGIVNGQGTPIKREDGSASSHTYKAHSTLTPVDANSTYPSSVLFSEYLYAPKSNDSNHKYTINGTTYIALAYYSGHTGEVCKWNLEQVDMTDKNVYTVSISGASNAYVTKTATDEKAFNTGFFVCSTTPTTSDFTALSVDGYNSNITVDESNKTINVSYTENFATFQAQLSAAKEVLNKTGVGYPTDNAASRSILKTAIETAEAKTEETYAYADFTALQTALTTYKSDVSSIAMPQDGDTYVFTNIHQAGTNRYLDYSSSGSLVTVARGTTPADELPASAKFTCHKLDNSHYMFVNNDGKYLIWKGGKDGKNSNGYVDAYDADWCSLQVSASTNGNAANPRAFGCFNFGGKRSTSKNSTFIIKADGSFDQSNFTQYNNTDYSSAFQFEKVSYPNTVSFNAATGIDDVEYISTFSAPFATIKPTGVKAYVVKNNNNGTSASLEEVEGNIPANQGVVLTSSTADAVTMVPVAGEGTATIEGNLLGNTAGAAKTVAEGENIYVLSLAANASAVAFNKAKVATTLKMNKAYLTAQSGSAIALNFATGEVTGINTIATENKTDNAPVFDLTGRRVTKMVKGGLYIKAGKKVIAQ